eukprot:1426338-Rhodomonas_salina.1
MLWKINVHAVFSPGIAWPMSPDSNPTKHDIGLSVPGMSHRLVPHCPRSVPGTSSYYARRRAVL